MEKTKYLWYNNNNKNNNNNNNNSYLKSNIQKRSIDYKIDTSWLSWDILIHYNNRNAKTAC